MSTTLEQWLEQQHGKIDVDCGCVSTETLMHWMRVAYEAGNSPVTPDGWISCSDRMPEKNQNVLISVNFDSSLVEPLICSARYTGSTFRRGDATIKPGNGLSKQLTGCRCQNRRRGEMMLGLKYFM